ncbi:hypothetical protein AGMMS49941_04680 [Deferribacterales bacterium]|nr:hypothetical protein AGMMS49941_04680 [Deferribacterales bacterium]
MVATFIDSLNIVVTSSTNGNDEKSVGFGTYIDIITITRLALMLIVRNMSMTIGGRGMISNISMAITTSPSEASV